MHGEDAPRAGPYRTAGRPRPAGSRGASRRYLTPRPSHRSPRQRGGRCPGLAIRLSPPRAPHAVHAWARPCLGWERQSPAAERTRTPRRPGEPCPDETHPVPAAPWRGGLRRPPAAAARRGPAALTAGTRLLLPPLLSPPPRRGSRAGRPAPPAGQARAALAPLT